MKKTVERLTKPQKYALSQITELYLELEDRLFTVYELKKVTETTLEALVRKKYLKVERLAWNKNVAYYQRTKQEIK
jgi:hypothetical protein